MPIFDPIDRVDPLPANHLIGGFDYLNASGRVEAARVRAILEEMMGRYPDVKRDELTRRVRSRDERLHRGAVFELILHELLVRRGFRIAEVEPQLPNGRAPDFLVEAPDGSRFYLEATIAWGEAAATAGADRRMREALQAIDSVVSPDVFLSVRTRGTPAAPVAVRRLRRDVQIFVDGLVHEELVAAIDANRPMPVYQADLHGLHLLISPIPKHRRGEGGRAIGGRMLPGGVVTPHVAIASAIKGKAGRYGEMDLPYVVAVNALEDFARDDSVVDALFGSEAVLAGPAGHRWVRNPDGVWYGRGGPSYTRVSAVLSTRRLSAWDIGQRSLRLIYNPWAARALPELPLGIGIGRVEDERLTTTDGASLGELLGLPEGWPEHAAER